LKIVNLKRDMCDRLCKIRIGRSLPVPLPLDAERIVLVIAYGELEVRQRNLALEGARRGNPNVIVFRDTCSGNRGIFEQMLAAWPDSIRESLIDYHLRSLRKSLEEWPARSRTTAKGELLDEIRHGGNMPDVPLIVLIAMGIDPFMAALMPESYLRALNARKHIIYKPLVESVPRGEQRTLEDAGHSTIHTDRPDAVVKAIRDLVTRVNR